MTQLLPNGRQTFLDNNGEPLAGGSVYFYIVGTTTFKNTWQDKDKLALNTNPVVLDAAGRATIWGEGEYRQVVKDSLGNTIWDKVTTAPLYEVDLVISIHTVLAGHEVVVPFRRSYTLPAGFEESNGFARATATAQVAIDVLKNGVSIGTITWEAGVARPDFSLATATSLADEDYLVFKFPASADATLAKLGLVIKLLVV